MECALAGGVKVDARGRHPHPSSQRSTKAPHLFSGKKNMQKVQLDSVAKHRNTPKIEWRDHWLCYYCKQLSQTTCSRLISIWFSKHPIYQKIRQAQTYQPGIKSCMIPQTTCTYDYMNISYSTTNFEGQQTILPSAKQATLLSARSCNHESIQQSQSQSKTQIVC